MKVILFGNPHQSCHASGIAGVLEALRKAGAEIFAEPHFNAYLEDIVPGYAGYGIKPYDHTADAAHIAISLGGDGTFLSAAHWLAALDIPILGVNTGHLGYLTAMGIEQAPAMIGEIMQGNFSLEQRSMLQVKGLGEAVARTYALNEVSILRQYTSSMIAMETSVNGTALTTYKGDGLVVATPTGSTAYNMSVGGPILSPTVACLVLSPISPHSLSMRPIVVGDDCEISVVTRSRAKSFQVSLDGNTVVACPTGTRVTISKAPVTIKVVLPFGTGHDFASTLRNKLGWGIGV